MADTGKSNRPKSERVQRALSHLQKATVNPTDALALAKELKSERAFGYARKLLAHVTKATPPNSSARSKKFNWPNNWPWGSSGDSMFNYNLFVSRAEFLWR
jgi:hypothetical protein